MDITASLVDVKKEDAELMFDNHYAQKLRDHLKNQCVLDSAGVERLMPLLRRSFLFGFKEVSATFTFPAPSVLPDNTGLTPHEAYPELARIAATIDRVALDCYESLLFAMAEQLAAQDERIYRRPRH